jgi:hypothetical protein
MGGTSVLTFAVLHPDMVDGVSSLNGHANHIEYNRFQDAISASFGGPKDKVPEEYEKRSAEFYPHKLTMPVAFTIGENDTSVPPASIIRLAEKLKEFNKKILVISKPKGGHATNFDDSINAMEFMITGEVKKTETSDIDRKHEPIKEHNAAAQKGNGGIFFSGIQPAVTDAKNKVELGLKFYVESAGKIGKIHFYQVASETGGHAFSLWATDGKLLAKINVPAIEGSGWIEVNLPETINVSASTEYILSYSSNSNYPATADVFKAPLKKDGIMAVAGLYSFDKLGMEAPSKTYKNMNYFIDLDYTKN